MWALAAAAAVQLAPSPVYVAVVIAVCALLVEIHRSDRALSQAFPILLLLGIVFGLLRVVLTVLTTHGTGSAVLVTLPEVTLPRLLGGFTLGGTVEAQVLAQAGAEAFTLVGIMAVFGAFNAVVAHHQLLASVPRAFHEPALAVTVAVTILPSTLRVAQAARESDRARVGDGRASGRWLRTLMPVLETGMERAVALAESMDSRGFARTPPGRGEHVGAWLSFSGLSALMIGFLALVGHNDPLAVIGFVSGGLLIAAAVAVTSATADRTRYRPTPFRAEDVVVMVLALAAPIALGLLATGDGGSSLDWVTTPLRWPDVQPAPLAALALLSAPAFVGRAPGRPGHREVTP